MSFNVSADAYGRFMGRFSAPLAVAFADLIGDRIGHRVLDVGCGPGALTRVLVDRVGHAGVAAADPSPLFVEAVREEIGVPAVTATAEDLPFPDDSFDAVLAQLVVQFMADPVRGLREMSRVARPAGVVAASVWDSHDGGSPLSTFWRAATDLDPSARNEAGVAGGREGDLERLALDAGLVGVEAGSLTVTVALAGFEDWWEPFTLGVGPAGAYLAGLAEPARTALRLRCQEIVPSGPFAMPATAWTMIGAASA